ncbi:MAG: saccharopine dehydrogenase C-terminal domain-containing protein [Anaerolineae bacterium]
MMKKVVVLGAGMVGGAMAADLCTEYEVVVVDADRGRGEALAGRHRLTFQQADLMQPAAIAAAVAPADLVIGAVPGFMGFQVLAAVIAAGKNVVDISFFPEDPFALDELARQAGVTAVVDCGVAPGLGNLILGYHYGRMAVDSFECMVGGLPTARPYPWQYKAPFSPIDVIEEYTRPARLVVNGEIVVKPALSDAELVTLAPVGELEAFNTDGLRTLLRTVSVPHMRERTLRYPGHIELIRVLQASGFFDATTRRINGAEVQPLAVTAALLFEQWRLTPGEPEFTIMRVQIRGRENDQPCAYSYHLYDETDAVSGTSSMARTTGYTCTGVARLLLDGTFRRTGICPPEFVGADADCFERVLAHLAARGVHCMDMKTI